jgi:hypothetical protein
MESVEGKISLYREGLRKLRETAGNSKYGNIPAVRQKP